MFLCYLLPTILVLIFNYQVITAKQSLESVLTSTTHFFDKLKLNYETREASPELYEQIDNELVDYVRMMKKSTHASRRKRQLDSVRDIGIVDGLEKVPGLDFPNAIDVTFFVYRNFAQQLWYAAALHSSGISLLQYRNELFVPVGSYDVQNGTRIISHSSEIATILVVQRSVGEARIIRFSRDETTQTLHEVQTLGIPVKSQATLWRGMKEIYLAVSYPKNLTVFAWLGEHFDSIQSDDLGGKNLVPFQIGGSMHLIAVDEARTFVLKFSFRSNEFVVSQKLVGARDATAFHCEKGHKIEHFIALAGDRVTVVYKQSRHRFVPFQEISGADEIRSLTNDAAVLLILLKNGELTIYQYDGWKLVVSEIRANDILNVIPVSWNDDQFLALRRGERSSIENSWENRRVHSEFSVEGNQNLKKNDYPTILKNNDLATSSWSFQKISWRRRKTWSSLHEESRKWCESTLDKTLRIAPAVPNIRGAVRIAKGHINKLRVHEVNDHSAVKFADLAKRWNVIVNETSEQKIAVNRYISRINPTFESLRVNTVRANCTRTCRATKIVTAVRSNFLEHLRRVDRDYRHLEFENVKVSIAANLRCPVPALTLRDASVSGLVNGIDFEKFANDALRITGDQEFFGSPTFAELRVSNAKIPLDVASNHTPQEISARRINVSELSINMGGILLPLNGGEAVLTGSLTVPRAKINGLIHMEGKIRGQGGDNLSPMIHVMEPLNLDGNFDLRNVRIVETLVVKDLTRSLGKSFEQIVSNAIPLNSSSMPVHLKLRNDKVSWTNITLRNFPYKWVTKKHEGHVIITGDKYASMPRINLGASAFENLPTPRLPLRLCGEGVISDGLWESKLVIDRGSAKSLRSINIFDQSILRELYLDSATSLEQISWASKNLTGRITVNQSIIGKMNGMDYEAMKKSISKWVEPGNLRGPVIFEDLKIDNAVAPVGFVLPIPLQVGFAKSTGNIHVGNLNGLAFDEFLENIVEIEDTMSLTNVTFGGGLTAHEIFASRTSFSLRQKESLGNMGSKEISGTLETDAIIVPDRLHFFSSDSPVNIIAVGNVIFANEPTIVNVNHENLEELYRSVWLNDRATAVIAELLEFNSIVSFKNDMQILKSFNTPNLGPWNNIEDRLLSKTRPQTINYRASFASIRGTNLFGAAKSHLRSNVSYLNDLEFNSLKRNETQVVRDEWSFDELIVTGKVNLRGKINKLNLATQVARDYVGRNVITGKKTFNDITARNIVGLQFGKFARNALRKNNGNRAIVVKGWKSFKTVEMQSMRVDGKIMGSTIETSLLRSSRQSLRGKKIFRGSLTTPEIVTNKTVNDIDLEYMVKFQLRKRANSQTIKTPLILSNDLTILGNMTINGLYHGVELTDSRRAKNNHHSVVTRTSKLLNFAEGIDVALQNRATYWDKLELLERNSTPLISGPVRNETMMFDGLGLCRIHESALYCNDRRVFDPLSDFPTGTNLLRVGVVKLWGIPLVASITLDPESGVFIHRFDIDEKRFLRVAALRVPGIIAGSLTTMDCLWVSLRLADFTMILRYELWAHNFDEWTIPAGSGAILMSSTPTGELLILRNDGVWKLGGLAGPRRAFSANLDGQIDTFSFGSDYYVQLTDRNVTTLLKTRYIGN